jgi:hypothetical protein
VHHIVHWEDGGATNTDNLVCLCPAHHRLHHCELLGVAGNPDLPNGMVFTDQRGREITGASRAKPPNGPAEDTAERFGIDGSAWRHPSGEHLDPWCIDFSHPPEPGPPEDREPPGPTGPPDASTPQDQAGHPPPDADPPRAHDPPAAA